MNIYQENGFANRRAYLESLCDEYPRLYVYQGAQLLGPEEDFDGLISMLQDAPELEENIYIQFED